MQATVKMFANRNDKGQGAPPFIDFSKFDVPAIGPTGVPLPPPQRMLRPDGGFEEFRNDPFATSFSAASMPTKPTAAPFVQLSPSCGPTRPSTLQW